ncbi:hypothetical protein SAMN05421823_104261 [Catalinimonas alkaloidigena]|uniref:Phosphatidate cytidylyltransferase n=1 Tax=Catalinimonas alkaloidigena TaxID=1075417 RepID=A0A1G9GZ15_9BACT|nr:hypothetical protein [Catalinimonas alkaloidigena]SDL05812.1 hypothetical protein SAMN05421823_104261 [Catalinimonas alkaloidigena]
MQKFIAYYLLILLVFVASSCEVVEGIFKAGVWVGVLLVVGIIALIIWVFSRFFR